MEFVDRYLKCSDCGQEFVFTAGEQLFFYDKQFKNDPKRCKGCKAKRSGRSVGPEGAALPLSRTETRTQCSECGVETTVPFKPTQGRPVLCRSCFQMKRVPGPGDAAVPVTSSVAVPSGVAAVVALDSPEAQVAAAEAALAEPSSAQSSEAATQQAIAESPAAVLEAALAETVAGEAHPALLASSVLPSEADPA